VTKTGLTLLLLGIAACGCVQRKLTITSEPSGALVYINHREAGRTPFSTDFTWYGDYDMVVRKEGYQTIVSKKKLAPPWWQIPPIDLFAEITPGRKVDEQKFNFTMKPQEEVSAGAIMARANDLRRQLPTTQPAN
jgi:hypothetical protein